MDGYLRLTAARTFFFSAGVPCWATRANALRAWALSSIRYFFLLGRAKELGFIFALPRLVLRLALVFLLSFDFWDFLAISINLTEDEMTDLQHVVGCPYRGADPDLGVSRSHCGCADELGIVSCDYDCRARLEPATFPETVAALTHWRFHPVLSGCSHAK
jgi:hypothetical protein